jgi:hypothetical protein
MSEKSTETQIHTVTLQFAGPLAEQMANHFFTDWLDGGLDQIWEERLDDADVAESIEYEADAETRTFAITGIAQDNDEDEESEGDEPAEDDNDEDSEAAAEIEGNPAREDA